MTTVETAIGQAKTMVLNMGPQHPSTHGVLRILLELDGETVVKAVPDCGYLHTGIEKSCEDKTYSQAITLTDRMDYLNPLGNNLVYCMAVEKLLDLEVPKRAQYIRVMMVELQRISSHLVWLGTHAIDLGAMSVFLYCFREREEILKIFEMFAGQRMMTSYIRIGGVALQPPAGWRQAIERFLKYMPSRVDEYETLLTENRIWMGRTKNIGYISAEDAIALSMTGPTIRAAGVAYDNRKLFPYSSYDEFEFDVPTRTDSDCFARYMIRVAEMRESLKIVRQALDKITDDGAIKTEAPGIVPPAREKMKTEMEALIYHFKIFTEGFSPPAGEAFVTVESPRGELGCFIASDGSPKPLRVHFRSPSFINLQALPKLVKGQLISDVIACIGTIDIVLGEVDR
ncbi:MAG TPA: NADH dehydrogenase (quinone) subunit D [Methylomirabilota bacterium]|jgi:NADH-quinone oxidoreductase subunit D|nr:NADH dehydrogenase (quinone) subunit D [Methylomirabilota bacterium]